MFASPFIQMVISDDSLVGLYLMTPTDLLLIPEEEVLTHFSHARMRMFPFLTDVGREGPIV